MKHLSEYGKDFTDAVNELMLKPERSFPKKRYVYSSDHVRLIGVWRITYKHN